MKQLRLTLCVALLLLSGTALAQAPTSGFRAEFLQTFDGMSEKVISLAEAIPAEQYTWRPAEGVRSISEAFLHIAGANYGLPNFIGMAPPEGFQGEGFDTATTDKEEVLEALRGSAEHVRQMVMEMDDADADKMHDFFGGSQTTTRGFLMFLGNHMSEHLGQLIAYARMNDVTPPWSQQG